MNQAVRAHTKGDRKSRNSNKGSQLVLVGGPKTDVRSKPLGETQVQGKKFGLISA